MTDTKKLRPLPGDLESTDLTGLQNLHSEMLATCSDISLEPPADTLVEITGVAQGLPVVRALHEAITIFLAPRLADDEGKSETGASAEKPAPKKKSGKSEKRSSKPESPQEAMARQKKARLDRDAQNTANAAKAEAAKPEKEKKMAKKATKKAAKKAASGNARTSVDENKKITWLLKDKDLGAREGSERAERRRKLKSASGKTVGAYLKAGGSVATLNRAVTDKVVKVA